MVKSIEKEQAGEVCLSQYKLSVELTGPDEERTTLRDRNIPGNYDFLKPPNHVKALSLWFPALVLGDCFLLD